VPANCSTSIDVAVGAASALFGVTLKPGVQYEVISTVAAWIATGGATPTAAAHTNGSYFVPAKLPILMTGFAGDTKLAIIQDSVGGFASIAEYV
jgi:hypothetical protein